jgi:hypothetical protein
MDFSHGNGRFLSIKGPAGGDVSFKVDGQLIYGLSAPFEGQVNTDRVGMSIRIDEEADAAANVGLQEWFDEISNKLTAHVHANAGSIFPKTPVDVIRENVYSMIDRRQHACVKTRVDLKQTQVFILDTTENPEDPVDKAIGKVVPKDFVYQVLDRGARVSARCTLRYVWLDETFQYGVTCSVEQVFVKPRTTDATCAMSLCELEQRLPELVIAEEKTFPGGAGRYASLILGEGYLSFMLNTSVGQDNDGFCVKFPPSPWSKDREASSGKLGMGVEVLPGSLPHHVLSTVNAMIIQHALTSSWFGTRKLSENALKAMFKPPLRESENYAPLLNIRVNTSTSGPQTATQVFLVPEQAETCPMNMATYDATECGCVPGTLDQIQKGSVISVACTATCVWIQSATFGWSLNATHVFVHNSEASAMQVDGQHVAIDGVANAEDIEAFMGAPPTKKHCGMDEREPTRAATAFAESY